MGLGLAGYPAAEYNFKAADFAKIMPGLISKAFNPTCQK